MGALVKAEFRKILTTRLWWALMIPAVAVGLLVALLWAAGAADFGSGVATGFRDRGLDLRPFQGEISWSVLALPRALNMAAVLPMVFGTLAITNELHHRTITTTFLTGAPRGMVLAAKGVAYALWGAIFGVVIALSVSLGTLIGSGGDNLPDAGPWLLILGSGVLMCVLWTLLGLGVGALIGSSIGALVLLLIYSLVVGPLGELLLYTTSRGGHVGGFMPNGSANGITGSTTTTVLMDQINVLLVDSEDQALFADAYREVADAVVRVATGAAGAYSAWICGLIFAGWTALFYGLGFWRNARRDIT
ncbi:ABC transporter permease subunit [Actinokineospora enzanensis]|uniref:ABC transporter permease subunit n=1 Tax=Actinokineospora enzanensis TaxID=155975 RepID=UPI00035F292C|nr:ABC transporter permease subunit [Actinokineospora enzanensis]